MADSTKKRQSPIEEGRKQYGIKIDPAVMKEVDKHIDEDDSAINRSQIIEDFLRSYNAKRRKIAKKSS